MALRVITLIALMMIWNVQSFCIKFKAPNYLQRIRFAKRHSHLNKGFSILYFSIFVDGYKQQQGVDSLFEEAAAQ
jgi:hypothetical protein